LILAFCLLVRRERLIAGHRGAGLFGQQILGPLQLNFGQGLGRLGALKRALCLLDRRLKGSFFNLIKRGAFFDDIALFEKHRL
jgi:hypothetical protein